MAGSQLKQLKAALKEGGLTGQTNVKRRKSTKKAPSETRRDDKQQVIDRIREQFNPFEIKVNRQKRDLDTRSIKGAQGKPGISKQIGEDQRRAAYEAKKAAKNKTSVMRDRRFGESDSTMTPEEKMLERFTREKQMQSKMSMFSLDDDEDDDVFGEDGLTHYGKSLADDFQVDDDLKNGSDDDDFLKPKKRSLDDDEDDQGADVEAEAAPQRKKTKAEVMKEVMAKSKYYKQQRQLVQERVEEDIMDLDEDFDDVMGDLRSVPKPKKSAFAEPVPEGGMANYNQVVKELALDKRAAPADRTKTDEELRKERADKMRELENARLRRMEAMDNEGAPAVADDLDDDFWVQGSGDEGEGFAVGSENEESAEEEEDDNEDEESEVKAKSKAVVCPTSHPSWLAILEDIPFKETVTQANRIVKTFAPHLQAGNKEKLATFTRVLFQHILYISEVEELVNDADFKEVQEGLISTVKKLSEKYNNDLTEALRDKIQEIHERIVDSLAGEEDADFPMVSDLAFFAVVGRLYSTSDHYHLVVTPASIVMGEALEQVKYDTLQKLVAGVFIAQTFLTYQRISKRYIPEVTFFLQKALLSLIPGNVNDFRVSASPDAKFELPKTLSTTPSTLRISDLEREPEDEAAYKTGVLSRVLSVIELALDTYKDKTALIEFSAPFTVILEKLSALYPSHKQISAVTLKFTRLLKFAQDERKPLTLQHHKKLAIASYAPKFEENFNPEKKSYDPDRQRQEINKMRAQIKQEKKLALKELRKDTRFEARQQIKEKKESYADYHSKMARILNTINTVEGAEKNEYEREKKLRKGKK
ncbi:CYFA0S01e18800g1_1 [Cyberlindnera fabianii]|uniref:CYFA0S01e18800g1_1 n=1 Tax=Cyberlindnera fabianii TaxID=36022 RepID=A0A061AL72_CYBFA|nr:CYFA0S01e18800g1_1 [Cyberlindnera fabianii]